MIPRTRANFSLPDVVTAALVTESGTSQRARLRSQLARFIGVEDALLTASGRGGLYAILKAFDRPRVVAPAYTCNAVTEAARLAGYEVEYVDAEPDGFNVDVERLAARLGPDALFLATHQFGIPCDIERIVALCRERGAIVVEDAAASLGTRVGGKMTGTFGDAAFFSFDISKLVTVPLKGGAVVARDADTLAKIRAAHDAEVTPMPLTTKANFLAMATALVALQAPSRYRRFHVWRFPEGGRFTAEAPLGAIERTAFYRHDFTEWQSSIAVRQMTRIDELVERRRDLYARYESRLRGASSFRTPPPDTKREWAPIRFPIRVHEDKIAFYRAAVKRGVDFAFSFTFIEAPKSDQRAHELARTVLDLPFYADLTDEEFETTVTTLLELDEAAKRKTLI